MYQRQRDGVIAVPLLAPGIAFAQIRHARNAPYFLHFTQIRQVIGVTTNGNCGVFKGRFKGGICRRYQF